MSNFNSIANTIVLLPFATSHPQFNSNCPFHPAALLSSFDKKQKINTRTDYSGYSSVKAASCISHIIAATIPPRDTPQGLMLRELLSTFVDPANILCEVECIEHEDTSIASQVGAAFKAFDNDMSVTVIWPYQLFNLDEPFLSSGNAKFAFVHGSIAVNRENVPECIGIVSNELSNTDMVCARVAKYENLDPIIRGQYSHALSAVEITRNEWAAFMTSDRYVDRSDISLLIQDTLVGERGVLVNPRRCGFI